MEEQGQEYSSSISIEIGRGVPGSFWEAVEAAYAETAVGMESYAKSLIEKANTVAG